MGGKPALSRSPKSLLMVDGRKDQFGLTSDPLSDEVTDWVAGCEASRFPGRDWLSANEEGEKE